MSQNMVTNLNNGNELDIFIDGTAESVAFQRLTREEQLSSTPEMQIKCSKPHVVRTPNAFAKDCVNPERNGRKSCTSGDPGRTERNLSNQFNKRKTAPKSSKSVTPKPKQTNTIHSCESFEHNSMMKSI